MQVVLIGTGYVGLTTGAVLAMLGHDVACVDVDAGRIDMLRSGMCPIYEPGLEQMLELVKDRLTFTTSYVNTVPYADVVFIAVGTPEMSDGSVNLEYVKRAASGIGSNLGCGFTVVVNKSTVPVGSANLVEALIRDAYEEKHGVRPNGRVAVASNPEFLQEGNAICCTLFPDRIVVGASDDKAFQILVDLYADIVSQTFVVPEFIASPADRQPVPFVAVDLVSAEIIKYAANAFLALKISFANEMAQLAEHTGANVLHVVNGVGLDGRIGTKFLNAGLGWGGSCFGKDTAALIATGQEYGLPMSIVRAAREVNYRQRVCVIDKLLAELKILKGRTIGLLGLAFKPDTDDLRDSPALDLARRLLERGAKVRAHDPKALERSRREAPLSGLTYCDTPEDAAHDCDALVLATEWPQYARLDWEGIANDMSGNLIVDGRNVLDAAMLRRRGFVVHCIGR